MPRRRPRLFLDILEQDLRSADPKVHALMQPAEGGMFSSPGRTGLVWALEVLAWNPLWAVAGRVDPRQARGAQDHRQLGEQAETNRCASIFRCWIPQTAAPVEDRIAALELLIRRHPQVGWRICIDQFDPASTTGDYTSRPRWRRDAIGAVSGPPRQTRYRMARKALDLGDRPGRLIPTRTLSDLVERMRGIPPGDQEAVWSAIETWAPGTRRCA